MNNPIKKGARVFIKPEWQDDGDQSFEWIAAEDEDGGRVRIIPIGTGLTYPPSQVVAVSMLADHE